MAEDVKEDVIEIPAKRLKLDTEKDDHDVQQEYSSNNNSAMDKLASNENMPSTSSDSGSHQENRQEGVQMNTLQDDDSDSDISDISGLSETAWKSSPGTMAWIHRQMMLGQNPRVILRDLISKDAEIDHMDDMSLWEIIVHIMSEPPKRNRLEEYHTLDHALNLIKSCQKIVVLTGAGVSVSCGIPDFRSRDGIYARLAVDFPNLPDPQAMFDINFFIKDQRPFFKFAKEIYPGQFEPSRSHKFIRLLETNGKLLRNYTQNIDTLEQVAGIQRVIQCHGSFATATCMACKRKVEADDVREDIFNQVIPRCTVCPEGTELAIMKPDIVFFGESLPEEFHQQMAEDKQDCDLLIVIGSSLKVRPVALIPNSLPQKVPQILINREPLIHLNFDIELLGDCDVIISELCKRLAEGFEVLADSSTTLTEITRDQLRTPPIPSPPKYARETSVEDKMNKPNEDSNEAQQGKNDTEEPAASSEVKSNLENSESADCVKPEISACTDGQDMSAISSSKCLESNINESTSERTSDKIDEPVPCDSTTNDMRAMWQPKKVSLAKYLEDGEYLYLPPNIYAFPGAEIYSDGESEDEDYFRSSNIMSSSSSSSSLVSQDNFEQTEEENESPKKPQESSQNSENRVDEDIHEMTGEDRISISDSDNHDKLVSQTIEILADKAISCEPDSRQDDDSPGESTLALDANVTQSKDAPLPDSSNSSI